MALGEEGGGIPATMLVGPANVGNGMAYPYPVFGGMGGGSGMNNGFGDGAWIILLILVVLAAGGGWGNNGSGGGFGGQPIIVNDGGNGSVQRGFDQAATMAGLNGIQSGIAGLSTQLCGCCGDISTQLCNGFNGVTASVNNAQNAIAQQLYANTIADLERSFAAQTASTQGMTGIQSQLAQCCCDNRLATESLRATVLSENCADRYEAANNTRDIITALTSGIQSIKDEICADRLEGYKRENDALRTQLNMANLAASQSRQTTDIQTSIINELRACPIPSQPVYGSQPIFTCPNNNNNGCGCGCGGNF